ncbi:hypothetical protein OYT1_ch0068 [Ferriphaselus amnicola]|uniref:Uncharacterized protein n=1 Tax=Ferriphaselus amnicola TaxID=1188319 RepID=A0A2Z6G8C6_9PROT|nr:hypothetical protein [Ferriphaselus amnicola]BBE49644.1 hypothetical protein OYT1_ch0068 [Ferriphaselus amnicola]
MINPFETQKERELFFTDSPAGQVERALELLTGLYEFKVERGTQANSLRINYDIQHYSLEGLEHALVDEGFRFEDNALRKLGRKLIYYCEDVQYHNLKMPEWQTKTRGREIFVKVYEHHSHGDHDETPKELRDFK